MLRLRPVALSLLLTLAGCFRSYHDLSDTPEARDTHLIGKRYELVRDLSVVRFQDDRFCELAEFTPSGSKYTVYGTVPRGTVVQVKQIVEENRITISFFHPLAEIEGKQFSQRRVSLIKALGGMSFGFGGTFSSVPDYRLLSPYLPHRLSGVRSDDLLHDLHNEDFAVRYWAARKLGELPAPLSPTIVTGLISATADEDPEVRLRALQSLKPSVRDDPAMIHVLVACLVRPSAERHLAHELLVKIGNPALPYVAPLLDGDDERAMSEAAYVLAEAGPAGKQYLPKLAAAIPRYHDQPSSLVTAMSRLDAEGSVGLILPLVNDRNTRKAGIAALAQLAEHWRGHPSPSPVTDQMVAVMTDALNDPDEQVRVDAARALDFLGPLAKSALPRLKELLATMKESYGWPRLSKIDVERAIQSIEGAER